MQPLHNLGVCGGEAWVSLFNSGGCDPLSCSVGFSGNVDLGHTQLGYIFSLLLDDSFSLPSVPYFFQKIKSLHSTLLCFWESMCRERCH